MARWMGERSSPGCGTDRLRQPRRIGDRPWTRPTRSLSRVPGRRLERHPLVTGGGRRGDRRDQPVHPRRPQHRRLRQLATTPGVRRRGIHQRQDGTHLRRVDAGDGVHRLAHRPRGSPTRFERVALGGKPVADGSVSATLRRCRRRDRWAPSSTRSHTRATRPSTLRWPWCRHLRSWRWRYRATTS